MVDELEKPKPGYYVIGCTTGLDRNPKGNLWVVTCYTLKSDAFNLRDELNADIKKIKDRVDYLESKGKGLSTMLIDRYKRGTWAPIKDPNASYRISLLDKECFTIYSILTALSNQ